MTAQQDDRVALDSPQPVRVTSAGLRQLLALSPDALLIVDQAGTIVMANEQIAALFGYSAELLQEQPLEMLLPTRQRTAHIAHRQHYMNEPSTRSMGEGLSLVGLRRDGGEFPVDVSLRPVLLDDRLLVIGAVRDVSQQRRIEREHAQQAELLDLAHDAILVRDSLNRVTFWNKGAEDLYGWSADEAQGRITHTLLHTRFPIDLATVEAALEQDGYWEGELMHTCRDGHVVVVESRQAIVRDEQGQPTALMEINRDITKRRHLEQADQTVHMETRERLSFLQQVLDALPSSVYIVYGSQARLLLANRAAASFWGVWPPDQPMLEFLAENRVRLLNEQGSPLSTEQYATLRAVQLGETVLHQQETIHRPGTSSLPVLVSALPLLARPSTGQLASATESMALVVHQDVSSLKQAEYLKDEFIGVAAHELRNPLAALKGYASMLVYQTSRGKGVQLSEWQQEALEEIEQASSRLDKLTEDLLDVTRLQAGRLVLSRKPTDLVVLTRHMIEQAQMSTQHHTLSLQTPLTSLMVEIDGMRIEQVLRNLLSNAVKYSPLGGLIEVSLCEESELHVAQLTIRDGGIGIPANQQARLFGRFVRAENARTAGITGTGLGLYLSREFVERHGGQLWFESTEGIGTTFFLRLPVREQAA